MNEDYGPAPLTFGQMAVWRDIDTLPRSRWQEANWVFSVDVPAGLGVPDVRAALDRLAERHGSLRTTYDVSDPEHPTQSLRRTGELPLDFEVAAFDSAEAVKQFSDELRARPFDLRSELPYRAVLADAPDGRKLLIGKHHIAADGWAMELLADELSAMFRGDDDALLPPSENLCLLAREQHSAAWQRRREASERHIRAVLSTPAARFRDQDPAYGTLLGSFESARLHKVGSQVARECHVSLSTVLISAFARALSQVCTDFPVRFGLVASNRFGTRWTGLVTSMNQLISIPLQPGEDCLRQPVLEDLQAQTLRAYRLAMHDYDSVRPARLGLPADTDPAPTCLYNISPSWGEQVGPIQDGEVPAISWQSAFNTLGPRCMFRVGETTANTLVLRLRTTGIGEAITAFLLQQTYSTIVAAASEPGALQPGPR